MSILARQKSSRNLRTAATSPALPSTTAAIQATASSPLAFTEPTIPKASIAATTTDSLATTMDSFAAITGPMVSRKAIIRATDLPATIITPRAAARSLRRAPRTRLDSSGATISLACSAATETIISCALKLQTDSNELTALAEAKNTKKTVNAATTTFRATAN